MKINKYPDGTSYVNDVNAKPIIFKINSYEDLWHLNQYVDAFISEYSFKPNVIIPNLIDAQADKRFNKGESSGLKLVLKFLASLPVKQYQIFHPHNQEVVEAMLDNVEIIDNSNFIISVLNKLTDEKSIFDKILMASDAGGYKPLMKLCDKINWKGKTTSASKYRNYIDGKTTITQIINRDDFQNKNIVIVDDISVYGGTFKGLSKLLKERNCGKLYLAVSHMTVQNLKGDDPVTNYFDKIFTTNSKFDQYYIEDKFGEPKSPKNLEIIKLF